ncbi:MAG: hypothetical protein ABS76_36210 [Pelagibacterium sp. SCN 64-44]|nr:MAG: hypothetical protein ABS76_36210 [Pelagibacterium sp. SCN 64-44]
MLSACESSNDWGLDRICPPIETVERMRPHLHALGITRIAQQTGLDRLGIPTFASIRPNAALLSVNQGKGIDNASAMASAIMEAAEFAIAEHCDLSSIHKSVEQMEADGLEYELCARLTPFAEPIDTTAAIHWIESSWLGGGRVWIPREIVQLDGRAGGLRACQTTNGLASGNSVEEAILHALCELIERDAFTCWSLKSLKERLLTCVHPSSFEDRLIEAMVTQIEMRGLSVRLFDQTTDIGVPVIAAIVVEDGGREAYFNAAAGYGAHPEPAKAALRALTEAAQTRITSIASARDDIAPDSYGWDLNTEANALMKATPVIRAMTKPPRKLSVPEAIEHLRYRLDARGVQNTIMVDLSPAQMPFYVVRLINLELEDMEANTHWRPGPRALKWILS